MNKILITGASGLVGSRFLELSNFKDKFLTPGEDEFNLLDVNSVHKYIQEKTPNAIIHFAAYTNVSEGEKQRNDKNGLCFKLNVEGLSNFLEVLPESCYFVQISTDLVFPGDKDDPGPYEESHSLSPSSEKVTWYGYTKALGEDLVKDKFKEHSAILRLIYPVRAKFAAKSDYLRKPLQLFDDGKLYPMFDDQRVSISFVDEICLTLDKMLTMQAFGLFHASSTDTATPFEIISYLIERARNKTDIVKPTSLDEFLKTVDNPVRYPKFGGLKVEETQKILGIKFSSWREIVDRLVEQGV